MSLSYELAPEIRVNGIAPGAIMFPEWLGEEEKQRILTQIPMKREGTVEEIAETALFLAEGPNYITGQIIGVDGGLK
jgi:pteridine reductase